MIANLGEPGWGMVCGLGVVDNAALMIPILAIVFGCSIPIAIVYLDYRKRRTIYELHHRERLAAIDKGLELPPLPLELLGEGGERAVKAPPNYLLRGLVWLAVGGGMYFAGGEVDPMDSLAFIPLLVGLAILVYYAIEGRKLRAAVVRGLVQETPKT